jgi:hypothetical protein
MGGDDLGGPAPGRPAGAVLAALAGVAAVLLFQAAAIDRQALTSDEAYHALAGHQADRYGRNGLNLEHPPLVKLAAALPLLAAPPLAPPIEVSEALQAQWAVFTQPGAEPRLRRGGRLVVVLLFGLPLLVSAFLLGRVLGGAAAGVVLALVLGLDFSTLPLLPLVYTDAAAALGFTLTLLAAARFLRRPVPASAALLGLAFGLAISAKFTGLLLLPAVLGALLLPPGATAGGHGWRRRLLCGALVAGVAWGVLELTYLVANRRYDPAYGRETIHLYCANHSTMRVGDLLQPYERPLLAVARRDPRAAQWLTGLLATRAQDELGVFGVCNFGRMSSRGRWWYFPVLLLVKTPLPLLAASAFALAAAALAVRRRARPADSDPVRTRLLWLLALTASVYLAAATGSNYNAGIRHLFPVLPLLYLPAALWAGARPRAAAALLLALGVESLALAPVWTSSTNSWWLGAHDPMRFALALDNAFYPQNLIALRETARRRGLRPLRVVDPAIPGVEIDAYLGAGTAMTPAAPAAALTPSVVSARSAPSTAPAGTGAAGDGGVPPGWYAVGASVEVVAPAILRASPAELFGYRGLRAIAETWGPLGARIAGQGDDLGFIAGTFHLYRVRAPAAVVAVPR